VARSDAGRAFVQSEGYKRIADPATRGQQWSRGSRSGPRRLAASVTVVITPAARANEADLDFGGGAFGVTAPLRRRCRVIRYFFGG
jgi:hypothetical protein